MAGGRRRGQPHHRRRIPLAVALGVVVLAVAVVGWTVVAPRLDGGSEGGSARLAKDVEGPTPHPSTAKSSKTIRPSATSRSRAADARADDELAACRTTVERGADAMAAAHTSVIADWAAHIQAMDALQSGDNSQDQTDKVWTVTRLRGPDRVDRFHSADAAYKKVADGCAGVDPGTLTAAERKNVDDCSQLDERAATALVAARGAVGEWKAHLKAMAARRAGKLDPVTAEAVWLAAYKKAPTNIARYSRAEDSYNAARSDCQLG